MTTPTAVSGASASNTNLSQSLGKVKNSALVRRDLKPYIFLEDELPVIGTKANESTSFGDRDKYQSCTALTFSGSVAKPSEDTT